MSRELQNSLRCSVKTPNLGAFPRFNFLIVVTLATTDQCPVVETASKQLPLYLRHGTLL